MKLHKNDKKTIWYFIGGFFLLWLLRVILLPSPVADTLQGDMVGTVIRVLLFLGPSVFITKYIYHEKFDEAYALHIPNKRGVYIAIAYIVLLIADAFVTRHISFTKNIWILLNIPFAPIIEELVFRGFLLTKLEKQMEGMQAVIATSIVFTVMHFPGWILLSHMTPIVLIMTSAQVFIFGFILGVIKRQSKSVYSGMAVHIINNFLTFGTI
jgi:membrane protease YdiL (CAAX protease family)